MALETLMKLCMTGQFLEKLFLPKKTGVIDQNRQKKIFLIERKIWALIFIEFVLQ